MSDWFKILILVLCGAVLFNIIYLFVIGMNLNEHHKIQSKMSHDILHKECLPCQ